MQIIDSATPREPAADTGPPSGSPDYGWADILFAIAERKRREEAVRPPPPVG